MPRPPLPCLLFCLLLLSCHRLGAAGEFVIKSRQAYRLHEFEMLQVARAWHQTLVEQLSLPLDFSGGPLEVELGLEPEVAGPISHALLRGSRGYFGLVRIPDPAAIDRPALNFALTAALLRCAIHNSAPAGATVTEPPAWFVAGLARTATRHLRGDDFETSYALWSAARLPGARLLWSANHSPAATTPALAAELTAWALASSNRKERWQALYRHLAGGGDWSPGQIATIWFDCDDLDELDVAWDRWLITRSRYLFQPGTTTPGISDRFRALLLLYPWECAIYNPNIKSGGTPLVWCLDHPESPGIRAAAAAKALQLQLHGAGRDAAFQAVTAEYAALLQRLAAGADSDELRLSWRAAERRRLQFEADLPASGRTTRPDSGTRHP